MHPATKHRTPWALIRRNGDTIGKRLSTRMAYLIDTIVEVDRRSIALSGYVMRSDMTGWTKPPRRIEWSDIIKTWRRQPSVTDVRKAKASLPVARHKPSSPQTHPKMSMIRPVNKRNENEETRCRMRRRRGKGPSQVSREPAPLPRRRRCGSRRPSQSSP